jgi:hypothetical protein
MRWDDIHSIKKLTKDTADSKRIHLILQTAHSAEPYQMPISNLDTPEADIIKLIQKFRNYNIYEIGSGEWQEDL